MPLKVQVSLSVLVPSLPPYMRMLVTASVDLAAMAWEDLAAGTLLVAMADQLEPFHFQVPAWNGGNKPPP